MKKCLCLSLVVVSLSWVACTRPIGIYEKDVAIPGQQWQSSFSPAFSFDISPEDTANLYDVYIVLRHTDAYNYNNIWLRGSARRPGDTAVTSQLYNLTLADNQKGWTGSGMDDIFEHRIEIQHGWQFLHPGTYEFTLQQVMREDPLMHVLNVGVRIEKAPAH